MLSLSDGDPRLNRELCGIAIMAKASRAGTCKTRLVPPLTHDEAAGLNTAFLGDIGANIAEAAKQAPIQGMVAYHPLGDEAFFETLFPPDFRLVPPRVAGLGRSLPHATRDILGAGYASMCLVNSDSPTLPTAYLIDAARLLAMPGDRVVLGPAADGGYYLIGLKTFHARLFEEIDWSTERVFGQTLARAEEIGLEVATLPSWYDVDDGETLGYLVRELFAPDDSAPYRGGNPASISRAHILDLWNAGLAARLEATKKTG